MAPGLAGAAILGAIALYSRESAAHTLLGAGTVLQCALVYPSGARIDFSPLERKCTGSYTFSDGLKSMRDPDGYESSLLYAPRFMQELFNRSGLESKW